MSLLNVPGQLKEYYWHIRVEGRDKAKRRRYYRYVAKEKLRLAEQGIDQKLISGMSIFSPIQSPKWLSIYMLTKR